MGKHFLWPLSTFALGVLLICPNAFARMDVIPGSRYTSARAAAMGDAFLPMGDDSATGLFYNPANLGKLRKTLIEPVNLSFYGNLNFFSSLDESSLSVFDLGSYSTKLSSMPGKLAGAGYAICPTFGFKGFAIGLLYQDQVAAQMNTNNTLSYRKVFQFIPTLGFGFSLFNGVVRLGYSGQWVHQSVGNVSNVRSNSEYTDGITEGSGFSHTMGFAMTLPTVMLPSINMVLRNVGGTRYTGASALPTASTPFTAPATEQMSMDLGISLHPRMGRGVSLSLVFVNRDMGNTSGFSEIGHLAFGAELAIRDRIFLRAGWRGGYLSAGLGLKKGRSEFSFAWFTEELGTTYLSQGDMKFMLQYQVIAF